MIRKWLNVSVIVLLVILTWYWRKGQISKPSTEIQVGHAVFPKHDIWMAPDSNTIPHTDFGDLVRYGKKLIHATAFYLGPNGSVAQLTNGMNCQNCHLDAGTRPWAGNFGAVAAVYPRFSERRGSAETIYQRIIDCFERSMNGHAPDSNSREMQAMKAYINWLGKDVEKGKKPKGTGLEILPFLDRPANPEKGRMVYMQKCQLCHGANGQGQPDKLNGFIYPPLWGEHSYNTAAGLYRISKFAGFIKGNMPLGSDYAKEQLNLEEAWDLAAFVNSQPRPVKKFKRDWPNIATKPADLPEGPFADGYSSLQHKYGPFDPINRYKKGLVGTDKK